jgi:hypothetical protein
MGEIDICPECLEHCDFEIEDEEEEEELLEDQKTEDQINEWKWVFNSKIKR